MILIFSLIHYTYVVGSSKNMTDGLLTNSRAMESRFICPPDSFLHRVSLQVLKPIMSNISSICKWS